MPDAVFELALRGTWNGKSVANVFHVKGDSLGDGLSTMAQGLCDAFYRNNVTYWDNAFTLQTWHARMIDPNPSLYEGTLGTPFTGTSTGSPLTNQTAVVVTTRTGYAGRRKRGRHYLPGLVSGYLGQDGRITPTQVSGIQTSITNWIATQPIGAGAYRWGVWSAKNGETRNLSGELVSVNIALGFTEISQVVVRDIPGVQRRRRLG